MEIESDKLIQNQTNENTMTISNINPIKTNKKTNLIGSVSSISTISSITQSYVNKEYYLFTFPYCQETDKVKYSGEYINEIYENMLQEERNMTIRPQNEIFRNQPEIDSKMRQILINWIVEIHLKFKLSTKALYLTVFLIDSYISSKPIQKSKFQLLGIAALLISWKMEDIKIPSLDNLVYICDNSFDKEELIKMEADILKTINYDISFPLSIDFYEILAKLLNFNQQEFYMGQFLMECFFLNDQFSILPGSVLACICIFVVMKFFNKNGYEICYDSNLTSLRLNKKNIRDLSKNLCLYIDQLQKHCFYIKSKYLLEQFLCVAKIGNQH